MLTGQVGLIHSDTGFIPWLIRVISRSHWTHMVVAISETECMSAEPGGARIRPISDYPAITWSQFKLRPWQRRRIATYARTHEGTPYGWLDFFAAGVALLTGRRTPEWLRLYVASTGTLICSQLSDLALQAAGIHIFHDRRPLGAVIPGSFGRYYVEQGWTDTP